MTIEMTGGWQATCTCMRVARALLADVRGKPLRIADCVVSVSVS